MGFLDTVVGDLMNSAQANPAMGSTLMNMLGGGQQGSNPQQPGMPGMAGGLGGLMSTFEQAGLGHLVQSWIGQGPNQPVSPQQLQSAFGDDQVQSMANQAGMAPHDFLSQLAQHLPNAVSAMTPGGQMPTENA